MIFNNALPLFLFTKFLKSSTLKTITETKSDSLTLPSESAIMDAFKRFHLAMEGWYTGRTNRISQGRL